MPVAEDWSDNPFALRVTDEHAIGLGACDIKGALAAMLCACRDAEGDLAILITSDEEAGNSLCVREFVAQAPPYHSAIVAEPTSCKAVASHRGVISGTVEFSGITGHASLPAALEGNAIHRAMRWGEAWLRLHYRRRTLRRQPAQRRTHERRHHRGRRQAEQ